MGLFTFALKGNYKNFYKELKKIEQEYNKSANLMFLDAGLSTILFGSGLSDYLNYRFYDKSFKQRKEYATIGYQAKFYKTYAKDEKKDFLNKINFNNRFTEFTKREFYYPDQGLEKLEIFLKKHPKFIVKPVIGLGGTGVHIEEAKDIKNLANYQQKLFDKELFLEEVIIQNKEWGKLSPNSVNTIRVMTSSNNGTSKIFFMAARIGSGKCIADNFHQGGMGALIDMEKGTLKGKGIDKKLNEYINHPASNIKIDGFKIPFFEEIEKICLEAALVNDSVKVIGWDVAITEKGPLIIEGNNGPGFDLVQVLVQHGCKYMLENIKNND